MKNNKIYTQCIPCSGTGRDVSYEYTTRYNSISRSYQRERQRVTRTCYRCSGNGKVVDQIATKEYQRQQYIKQQKRKQQQQKRIENQKKQAQYKQFTFKNKIWEQYVDNYNKDITQPLLGQKTHQQVQEKPSKSTNFKLEGNKFWQNHNNNEESYVVCGYCDGKGYDLMNMSQKCRGCGGSRKRLIKNTITLQKSPYDNYIPAYTQSTKGFAVSMNNPNNNPPPQQQISQSISQPILPKKKTEQQLRKQFQKMYQAQKRRLKRLEQQKRQEQERKRRKDNQRYEKMRQKQRQEKAIKQQQFYQSPQGRAYVQQRKIEERRRQRKNCIKNTLQAVFCCCGQVDDNRCLCWFFMLGLSFVIIMWFVVYPIIVSS